MLIGLIFGRPFIGHPHPSLVQTRLSMLLSYPPIRLCWSSTFRSVRQLSFARSRFFSTSVPRYAVEMGTVNTSERLAKLRQLMQEHQVDVYSMTSYDPLGVAAWC